jgi:transcriptional regulator with XRE-family HTH domain
VEPFALIGETLRRLRKDRGLTLDQLGDAAKLGRGQLSRIENGHQEATLTTLTKVLKAQGVSRREFFRRYDLVESEALGVERQQAGNAGPSSEGGWPQGIVDAMSRLEAFARTMLQQSLPVAQGAIEVGELVVLFRVVPKNPGGDEPASPPSSPPARKPRGGGRRGRRKVAASEPEKSRIGS